MDSALAQALSVRPGSVADADELLAIRRAQETWLADRGIRQWPVGHFTLEHLRDRLADGTWFVLTDSADRIHAALESLEHDDLWPDAPSGEAVYIHGLMVNRAVAAPGAGGLLLRYAEREAREKGASYVRLYCVATNPGLRDYYLRHGYVETEYRDFDDSWFSARLFEKQL